MDIEGNSAKQFQVAAAGSYFEGKHWLTRRIDTKLHHFASRPSALYNYNINEI